MSGVAVVVPTRDRPATLARSLASIRRGCPAGDYELVVVLARLASDEAARR